MMVRKYSSLKTFLSVPVVLSFFLTGTVTQASENPDKIINLKDVPSQRSNNFQSETSKKHRIRQRTFMGFKDERLDILFEIQNKDRFRGRTMCSKLTVLDPQNERIGLVAYRAGIKQRGNHTRYRTIHASIQIPQGLDATTLKIEVTDWYCPKGFGSRLGDTFDKSVIKAISVPLEYGGELISVIGTLKDKALSELSYSMKKIGGKDWQKAFDDVAALTRIADDKLAVELINSAKRYVETGKASNLDPLATFVAAQMSSAGAELYRKAIDIPAAMRNLIPEAIRSDVAAARYIEKKSVPEVSLPHIVLSKAPAVAVENVIVFRDGRVPGIHKSQDKFLWMHELFHVHQYKKLGTNDFAKRFLHNHFGLKAEGAKYPGVNPIESEADEFACSIIPDAIPPYIGKCP